LSHESEIILSISHKSLTVETDKILFMDFQMNSIGFKSGEYGGRYTR